MDSLIEPRVLKGFRDFLPAQEVPRRRIISVLEQTFTSYGFVPIDTPVLEYTEVLLGKGGGETDKQIYRFADHGGRDVAMRYDLTVPFARYMASHLNELYLPFKRYHIGKVYRGENTQRGRYREFVQCDFDLVGVDSASADFEILLLMNRSFGNLGVEDVTFHIAHRGVFNRFLTTIDLRDKSEEILRTVDKLSKVGSDKTRASLSAFTSEKAAGQILDYIQPKNSNAQTLESIERLSGGASEDSERLRAILSYAAETEIEKHFLLDPSITRGLDYYTGIVYETYLDALPDIGSVCSGGRYNDLASLYTKERIPGVGSSIGLDRLVAALEELRRIGPDSAGVQVVIFCLDEIMVGYYHKLSELLRGAGFSCEVYPDNRKLQTQFAFAEKKGVPIGIFCGPQERERDVVNVRDLNTRESFDGLSFDEAVARIHLIVQSGR
ncbi:MAG TPA: histidine--tRNA ligase [Spirochaetia bacterium]|nr:histidine--tRNA ligase [Spirochaetia bacterium]